MAKNCCNNGENEENKDDECSTEQEGCFGFSQQRSKWSQVRAVILSQPKEDLEAEPGSVIYVPVEFQNQTKWPWKRGCFIGLADRNAKSELIVGDVPVDFEVRGM